MGAIGQGKFPSLEDSDFGLISFIVCVLDRYLPLGYLIDSILG
jgi:hypothetical protein